MSYEDSTLEEDDYTWPFTPGGVTDIDEATFEGVETAEGVNLDLTAIKLLTSNLTTVFLPVVYIIIFIVGLPTNTMAIWVFLFRTKKKHPASILMANLALADLLFIIWLPLKISYHFNGNNWSFGEPLCKVLVGFFYGNMYCSTIFIAFISVQRYWAIVHPFSGKLNNQAVVCMSLSVWFVVWIITTPLYMYEQHIKVTNLNITTCHDVTRPSQSQIPHGYFLIMGIVGYIVPSLVCIVSYGLMFRFVRGSIKNAKNNKIKKRAIVHIITVLIMFLLCFTPSNIILMVHYSLLVSKIQNNAIYGFYIVALCLSSLNSCIDPFVYYYISEEFRSHVGDTVTCYSERAAKRRNLKNVFYNADKSPNETVSTSADKKASIGEIAVN